MKDAAQEQLDDVQYAYLQLLIDAGCKFQFKTFLFGKPYVWMRSPTGKTFLERIPETSA